MPHVSRRSSSALSRRTALGGAGAAAAALSLSRLRSAGAQEATPNALAAHPIVGAWLSISTPPPVPISFAADGTVTIAWTSNYLDPALGLTFQSSSLGAWEPVSERGIHFTAIQALTDAKGAYVGTFTLEGHPLVSADGQTFTDITPDGRIIVRDAQNAVLVDQIISGGVTAYRITPRSLIPGSPALPLLPKATPGVGTPTP